MQRTLRRFGWLAMAAALGCGGGPGADDGVAVRDSAGVTIVEIPARALRDAETWSLAPQPSLTIGTLDGAPEYQLFRVSGALRLDDGSIVVADGGSRSLRIFDEEGTFLRSGGGEGEGPGEYRGIGLLGRYGSDSLVVWDGMLRRATVIGADAVPGRVIRAPDFEGSFVSFQTAVGDGSLLGRVDRGVRPDELPAGVLDNRTTFLRLGTAGEVDSIGEFFGNQALITADRSISDLPFGRTGVHAAAPGEFHYSANDRYELRRYTLGGELTRIVRMARPNRPLGQPDIQRHVEADLARVSGEEARQRRAEFFGAVPFPAAMPAFEALRTDAAGNLWAAEYRVTRDDPARWIVLSPDADLLAVASTPAGLRVTDIGADYVLGVQRDELDVEHVVLYRIEKGRS